MIEILLKGMILGLSNSLSPGPLQMLIIRDTLRYGKRTGLIIAVSSFFADIPIVAISFLAGSVLLQTPYFREILTVAAILMLLRFAAQSTRPQVDMSAPDARGSFWNGMLATLINPHPYLFWVLVGVPWGVKAFEQGTFFAIVYFTAFQITFVGTNCIVALLTDSIGRRFSSAYSARAGMVAAGLFVLMAGSLAYELFASTPAQSKETRSVIIAVAMPVTGSDSAASQGNLLKIGADAAVRVYARELKEAGLAVRMQPHFYRDTPSDLAKTAGAIIQSQADVAFGFTFSDHVLLVADQFKLAKMPLVTPDATANRVARLGAFIHATAASNSYQALALVAEAEAATKTRSAVIIVTSDCGYCVDLGENIASHVQARGRIKSIKTIPVISREIDRPRILQEISSIHPKPDIAFIPNFERPAADILETLIKSPFSMTYFGGDGWSMYGGQVLRQRVTHTTQAFVLAHWGESIKSRKSAAFLSEMKEIPDESKASAAMAFDGMAYLIQTFLKCHELTRPSLEACFQKNRSFDALSGNASLSGSYGVAKPLVLKKVTPSAFVPTKVVNPPPADRK